MIGAPINHPPNSPKRRRAVSPLALRHSCKNANKDRRRSCKCRGGFLIAFGHLSGPHALACIWKNVSSDATAHCTALPSTSRPATPLARPLSLSRARARTHARTHTGLPGHSLSPSPWPSCVCNVRLIVRGVHSVWCYPAPAARPQRSLVCTRVRVRARTHAHTHTGLPAQSLMLSPWSSCAMCGCV